MVELGFNMGFCEFRIYIFSDYIIISDAEDRFS